MPLTEGQHEVEQHEVGVAVAENFQRLVTVGDERRLEPLALKHDTEHLGERRVVIDDKHTSSHGPHRST